MPSEQCSLNDNCSMAGADWCREHDIARHLARGGRWITMDLHPQCASTLVAGRSQLIHSNGPDKRAARELMPALWGSEVAESSCAPLAILLHAERHLRRCTITSQKLQRREQQSRLRQAD